MTTAHRTMTTDLFPTLFETLAIATAAPSASGNGAGLLGSLEQAKDWIPSAILLVALFGLVSGVVLLFHGGRLLRPGFVMIGGVLGSAVGAVYLPAINPQIGGIPSAYIGLAAGLLFGSLAAVIMYRFAMAVCAAVVVGIGAVLTTLVALSHMPGAIPPAGTELRLNDLGLSRDSAEPSALLQSKQAQDVIRSQVESKVRQWSDRIKDAAKTYEKSTAGKDPVGRASNDPPLDVLRSSDPSHTGESGAVERAAKTITDHLATRWQALPERSRLILAAAWMAGAFVGFLLGLVLPRKAAAAVTSLVGAAILLVSLTRVSEALITDPHRLLNMGATGWLGAWLALSALGLFIQARSRSSLRHSSPRPSEHPLAMQ
jgi:hypothetical protein